MTPVILGIAFVIFPVLPLVYVVVIFNRLVNLKNLVPNAWRNVDTELKRRYDLIPNLVDAVKGYTAHEGNVLEHVVAARTNAVHSTGSPGSQAVDENELVKALRQLFVVVEGYPELKASEHFRSLQDELINTENRIQAARRFYNGNVKDLNTLVEQFPSRLVANFFQVKPAEFFEIENALERQPVVVKL
jgi:LemA protein